MTHFFSSLSSQAVRIEQESLPTGIETLSAWQYSLAAFTAAKSLASSPSAPQAAIQFADNFTRAGSMSAAVMLVIASATAMRLAAAESRTATGVRSPTAITSPL